MADNIKESNSMTDTTEQQAVTQEDREIAARILEGPPWRHDRIGALVRAGKADDDQLVTAAMLSRLASVSSASAEGRKDTVAFVQEWMMSGDHEPDQWHRDFAAAIDARRPTEQSIFDAINEECGTDAAAWIIARIAASASPEPVPATNQAGEVGIKPLTWTEPHASHTYPNWYARVYSIKFEARIDTGKPSRHGKFPLSINGDMIDKKFETVEDAKAYAQNDYAQRILTSLATQPATSQEGEAMNHSEAADFVERYDLPDSMIADLAATPTPPTLSEGESS